MALAKLCGALEPGALQIRSEAHWRHSIRHRSGTMEPEVHQKNIVQHLLKICLQYTLPNLAVSYLIKKKSKTLLKFIQGNEQVQK